MALMTTRVGHTPLETIPDGDAAIWAVQRARHGIS
jgi:hypothetical protein